MLALVIFRLFLPDIVKRYVNRTLNRIPGYRGHIEDIKIHLWRGAYEIDRLDIVKIDGDVPVPFFKVKTADLSIQWRELFHGSLVGEIVLTEPQVNFVAGPTKAQSQTSMDQSWLDRVQELFPLNINHFQTINGSIHFRNFSAKPPIDIYLDNVEIQAHNLSNSRKKYDELLATLDARSRAMGHGRFDLNVSFNPFSPRPMFDLKSELTQLNVPTLNGFIRHYGGVVVTTGTVDMYMECAAKGGEYRGYVKPFIRDVHFATLSAKDLKFSEKLRGLLGEIAAAILKNRQKNSVATKVEFSGRFDETTVLKWAAVKAAFRHAFVHALAPKVDDTISFKTIREKSE